MPLPLPKASARKIDQAGSCFGFPYPVPAHGLAPAPSGQIARLYPHLIVDFARVLLNPWCTHFGQKRILAADQTIEF